MPMHITVTASTEEWQKMAAVMGELCSYQYIQVLVHTGMYCIVLDILYDAQPGTIQSAGCMLLDINLLKPSILEFQD